MKRCHECHQEWPAGEEWCPHCGALPAAAATPVRSRQPLRKTMFAGPLPGEDPGPQPTTPLWLFMPNRDWIENPNGVWRAILRTASAFGASPDDPGLTAGTTGEPYLGHSRAGIAPLHYALLVTFAMLLALMLGMMVL